MAPAKVENADLSALLDPLASRLVSSLVLQAMLQLVLRSVVQSMVVQLLAPVAAGQTTGLAGAGRVHRKPARALLDIRTRAR